MSLAEQFKIEGRVEGRVEGREQGSWIGRIQAFEEFLAQPLTSSAILSTLSVEELESRHRNLHQEYERRFKG